MRTGEIKRETKETIIELKLNLDGNGIAKVETGIGFFDHMLTALAVHAGFDLDLVCDGDLEVDAHHSVEDVGIVLGRAFAEAVGDKAGIARYGNFSVPMDEALGVCSLDISGRGYLVFDADFRASLIGELDSQLVVEFFRAFAINAAVTLHLSIPYGENDHHKCEALFKAFAHALRMAVQPVGGAALSSKGMID